MPNRRNPEPEAERELIREARLALGNLQAFYERHKFTASARTVHKCFALLDWIKAAR